MGSTPLTPGGKEHIILSEANNVRLERNWIDDNSEE